MRTYASQKSPETPHRVLWPNPGYVSDNTVLGWARDAEADGDIDGGFGNDVWEARRQLDEAGIITFGKDPP